MGSIFFVFIITAVNSAILGYVGAMLVDPLKNADLSSIKSIVSGARDPKTEDITFLGQLVKTFTVSDFSELISKSNMLHLIVFSVLFGLATTMVGEIGKPMANLLSSGTAIMMKFVKFIMYYALIGLGCYFATIIGELGPQILAGYARAC